jgi:hypothetical protein
MDFVPEKGISHWLAMIHESRACVGLEAMHRAHQHRLPRVRTVYRWHRRWSKQLSYFPSFSLEQLGGLVHLHLFLTRPDPRWARFPYAVESLWLSQNLVDPVLYLHCFVPLVHREQIELLLHTIALPHAGLRFVWSSNGWQRVRLGDYESLSLGFPLHTWPAAQDGVVPRPYALAIPILGEAWNQRLSLPEVWRRVQNRLGSRVQQYLRRRHVYDANGKFHVRDAYRVLQREGVFRQYVIRAASECQLLVVAPAYSRTVPLDVARVIQTVELFPTSDGGAFWRVQGSYDLLRCRSSLHGCAIYVVDHVEPPRVRLQYEWLFDPIASLWTFSADRIRQLMEEA